MQRLPSFMDWLAYREEVTGSATVVSGGGVGATTTQGTNGGIYPRRLFDKPVRRKRPEKITFNFGKQKG